MMFRNTLYVLLVLVPFICQPNLAAPLSNSDSNSLQSTPNQDNSPSLSLVSRSEGATQSAKEDDHAPKTNAPGAEAKEQAAEGKGHGASESESHPAGEAASPATDAHASSEGEAPKHANESADKKGNAQPTEKTGSDPHALNGEHGEAESKTDPKSEKSNTAAGASNHGAGEAESKEGSQKPTADTHASDSGHGEAEKNATHAPAAEDKNAPSEANHNSEAAEHH